MSNKQSKIVSYADHVSEAKRLRDAAAGAEFDFLAYLMAFEAQPEVWRNGQARVTFADVLEGENLARPMRYGRFVEAVKRFGLERVREIGVDAAIEGAKLTDQKQCDRFVEQAAQASAERGMPYSGQQARALRVTLTEPSEVVLPHERKTGRIAELEAENAKLRPAVREAEKRQSRVAELEAENAKLRAKVKELEREVRELRMKKGKTSGRVAQHAS